MYHPTELANALTPTSWFYSFYLHTYTEQSNDNDHPSRLEISFLLDIGASISVPNYPTFLKLQSSSISHVITKQIIFRKC